MTLQELNKKGVHVSLAEDDRLRISVPRDIDTPELKEKIKDSKDALVAEIKDQLSKGDALLEIWRRDSIPEWRSIRDESVKDDGSPDLNRRAYAIWMLEEVLHDIG